MRQIKNRQGRVLLHEEVCHRVLGEGKCSPTDCSTKYYYCDQHEFETVEKSKSFTHGTNSYTKTYEMKGVIAGYGPKSSALDHTTVSKGTARDHSMYKDLKEVQRKILRPSVINISASQEKLHQGKTQTN